jgi:hypothetical protein
MSALISLVGIAVLFTVAFLSSTNRRQINWRTVSLALLLQFTLGGIVLYLPIGVSLLSAISDAVTSVLGNAQDGIAFVFGPIGAFEMGLYICLPRASGYRLLLSPCLGPLLSWHHGLDHSRYWRRLAKVTRHEQSRIDVGDGEYISSVKQRPPW